MIAPSSVMIAPPSSSTVRVALRPGSLRPGGVVSGRPRTEDHRLFERNTGLIRFTIAKRFPHLLRDSDAAEDAWSVGAVGLLKAARDYDAGLGTQFSTCASAYITRELFRYSQQDTGPIHVPLHISERRNKVARAERLLRQRLGRVATEAEILAESGLSATEMTTIREAGAVLAVASLDSPIGDGTAQLGEMLPDPCDVAATALDRLGFERLMACLSLRDREVIERRFVDGDTLEEIGGDLGLSRERVRQIECDALGRMRAVLEGGPPVKVPASKVKAVVEARPLIEEVRPRTVEVRTKPVDWDALPDLMTSAQAAQLLGVQAATLGKYHCRGKLPRPACGLYAKSDLRAFAERRRGKIAEGKRK